MNYKAYKNDGIEYFGSCDTAYRIKVLSIVFYLASSSRPNIFLNI